MGFGEMSFDTYNLGATNPTGVAFDPVRGYLILVDSTQDDVYLFDIPAILRATTLTGTFTGNILGQQSSLLLRETGEGFLSGGLKRGMATYNSPGYFDTVAGEVTLTFLKTPYSDKTYVGTVSEDLNTLTFPSPIGVLDRKLQ